jgi:ubiquinone/menaquinone biosynthesis C-methylase UbiE
VTAVYDDVADAYDQVVTGDVLRHTMDVAEMTVGLLGDGPGRVLDVGCGTGAVSRLLTGSRWTVTGVDLSAAEVRMAVDKHRLTGAVVGDAHRLPVRAGSVDAVVSTYTHTDMDDWPQVVRSAAQALRPGGVFVYVGMHPCFVGPHAQRVDGLTVLHSGYYRNTGRIYDAPGFTPGGWRSRVGARHLTLAALLGPFRDARLTLNELIESTTAAPRDDGADMPWLIGLRMVKP